MQGSKIRLRRVFTGEVDVLQTNPKSEVEAYHTTKDPWELSVDLPHARTTWLSEAQSKIRNFVALQCV